MKISTIIANIDNGLMALPEFQRGYVWNRDQVRALFSSLYRRHPVGGLLVWVTQSQAADARGDVELAPGMVNLLLDGQQRITTVYSVTQGKPPPFFEGNPSMFRGLHFHLEDEEFSFYQPVKMRDDPLWIDVTTVMQGGVTAVIPDLDQTSPRFAQYVGRVADLQGILATDLHVEQITGVDKSLDLVVDIFNRVNSGGTKLSKGDLALAKICADWPQAREAMKRAVGKWETGGYKFNLDWLLRSVNTVLTGEARFQHLHDRTAVEVQDSLSRAEKAIDSILLLIDAQLGLDHDRVLFGRFAIPVMVRHYDQRSGWASARERDKLAFWFAQAGMWGRFSGSTETAIDRCLEILDTEAEPIDALLDDLRLWHGDLAVEPDHFKGWSRGARFYPVLYMLTRKNEAKDWGTGLPLKQGMWGKMNQLEMHHIFPKSRLYRHESQLYPHGYRRPEVNALANFCFLTKDTNLEIGNRLPADYLPEVEASHPGALRSQWIPEDPELWKIENYPAFLEARRELLANAANRLLQSLLHGDTRWLGRQAPVEAPPPPEVVPGGIETKDEEAAVIFINDWVVDQGLPAGEVEYECSSPTGEPLAVLDIAWPDGLQPGLSQPVAVLLDEDHETLSLAGASDFRCFTSVEAFLKYVRVEINPSGSEGPTVSG
ncbi:MAG: DUF262 domain-containing protein [Acidimicrobiia bacterium]|nr:DUF262 domain-containing protein [Acidimicrobiia bacterium]